MSECALRARAILAAARRGDVAALEAQLSAATVAAAAGEERLELLDAIAQQMRGGLVRMRQGLTDRWEDGEVCLALLEHLACDQWSNSRIEASSLRTCSSAVPREKRSG